MKKPADYVLEIRALPSDVPAVVRLRRLLKYALRGLDLRCVRATEIASGEELDAPDAKPEPLEAKP